VGLAITAIVGTLAAASGSSSADCVLHRTHDMQARTISTTASRLNKTRAAIDQTSHRSKSAVGEQIELSVLVVLFVLVAFAASEASPCAMARNRSMPPADVAREPMERNDG